MRPALGAIYTGQRRGDLLERFTLSRIRDGVWYPKQAKTGTGVPIPLHPVMLAIVEKHRAEMKRRAIIDPERPIFQNSRGEPWASGYGASWGTEMVRLKLHAREPRLVFHGLRTSNADLIASAVAKSPELFGSIERVKAQLGHLSGAMSEHYAPPRPGRGDERRDGAPAAGFRDEGSGNVAPWPGEPSIENSTCYPPIHQTPAAPPSR